MRDHAVWVPAFAGTTHTKWPHSFLPPQLPYQRPRRVAEQLLDRGGAELNHAFEVFGMDAAGHEQAIDPKAVGAGEIGSHGIPDRQNPLKRHRMAEALRG